MSLFYKSKRIGKNGKPFLMYKLRTLKEGQKGHFAQEEQYTRFGRFLRKYKLDELPQIWNVLKGDMSFFGYRPEEERTFNLIPESVKEILLKTKPGIIDIASVYFINEEEILKRSPDPYKSYWQDIRPMKFILQCFYIENKSWLLNLVIVYMFLKKLWKD